MEKQKRKRAKKENARSVSANWKYSEQAIRNATQMVFNTVTSLEEKRNEYVTSTRVKDFPSAFVDWVFTNKVDELAAMCQEWAEKTVQTDTVENLPHYRKVAILAKSENS